MASSDVTPLNDHPETKDFLAFLRLKNLSPQTIVQYGSVLGDLFRHIDPVPESPGKATAAHLRAYVADLRERGLAAKTINDRVIIIRRFYGFLLVEGYISSDPAQRLPIPKVGKRLPKALSLNETRHLLTVLQDETSKAGQRDKTLFALLYGCGLRVTEAVTLKVEDVDFGDGFLRVVGKGDKERRIYLKPALRERLRVYIAETKVTGYIFSGKSGGHISARNVRYRLLECAKQAGISKHVSPHILRHSIAVHYLQGGAPVSFVQGLLGHASLATTGVYLQLTDQMAKEITLKTETALEQAQKPDERIVGEARARYEAADEDWDAYVHQVLWWLSE